MLQLSLTQTPDELEVAMYNLARTYHGFHERVAETMRPKARPAMLRQSLNPFNPERPSFVQRAAGFFIAWLVLHPNSGIQALWLFVMFILQHAPTEELKMQILMIEDKVAEVKSRVEDVQEAIDSMPAMPEIRKTCRKLVKKRRLKQPPMNSL